MSGSQQKPIEVVFVYNKADTSNLHRDVEILEEALVLQARVCNIPLAKVRVLDPREQPLPCDICFHFEVPYAVWFSAARMHCMVVNSQEWTEKWNGYIPMFNQWIFKNTVAKDKFVNGKISTLENSFVMPWRCKPVEPKKNSKVVVNPSEWVWFVDKYQNPAAVISLWQPHFVNLNVYTKTNIDVVAPSNVKIKVTNLSKEDKDHLSSSYKGHICLDNSGDFSYAAAEAEKVGAFALLNANDSNKEYYEDSRFVEWADTDSLLEDLEYANKTYKNLDFEEVSICRKQDSIKRSSLWDKAVHSWFKLLSSSLNETPKLPKHYPPLLNTIDCPPISIVTLVYGRPKFLELAFHNLMLSDYPREKVEWVVVDDSPAGESGNNKIIKFEEKFLPGKIRYIPLAKKTPIGRKRNIGVKRSANDIVLMMDDDDHYPQTSFRRRVAWLLEDKVAHKCAVCTSLALYDLNMGASAVNVPPFILSLSERASEATLTFTKDFWSERPFLEVDMSEGEEFLKGRESDVVEMPPQQIIVAFTHGKNTSSRSIGASSTTGCFWGFPKQFLVFVHGLVGKEVEEEN